MYVYIYIYMHIYIYVLYIIRIYSLCVHIYVYITWPRAEAKTAYSCARLLDAFHIDVQVTCFVVLNCCSLLQYSCFAERCLVRLHLYLISQRCITLRRPSTSSRITITIITTITITISSIITTTSILLLL